MKTKENTWYLDNGVINHIYGDKDMFMELDESIKGNITFAYHSKASIKRKDTILIQMKNNSHQFIGNVYYIPIVKNNILSLEQLLERGYEIKMKDCMLTLLDTQGIILSKGKPILNKKSNYADLIDRLVLLIQQVD